MPTKDSVDLETRNRLRAWLKWFLLERGEGSQSELARRLSTPGHTVSRGTISAILSGDRTMGLDILIKLHRLFGESANRMLDDPPPTAKKPSGDHLSRPDGRPRDR